MEYLQFKITKMKKNLLILWLCSLTGMTFAQQKPIVPFGEFNTNLNPILNVNSAKNTIQFSNIFNNKLDSIYKTQIENNKKKQLNENGKAKIISLHLSLKDSIMIKSENNYLILRHDQLNDFITQ